MGSQGGMHRGVEVRGTGLVETGKIVCVGKNYREHLAEMGYGADEDPVLFIKPSTSLLASGAPFVLPRFSSEVHHEVELVIVIGGEAREVPEARALEHVLAYAVGLDLTCRDLQRRAKERGEPWAIAKGFDGAAPVSIAVPAAECGDPGDLAIELRVNGTLRQSARTSQMIHGVSWLVSYASRYMTLERGDLLMTGTPSGVGPLVAGDHAVGRIEGIGSVEIRVKSA